MPRIKMNYKNREIIKLAQKYGYTTASELANFLKKYKPRLEINESGKRIIQLSLI